MTAGVSPDIVVVREDGVSGTSTHVDVIASMWSLVKCEPHTPQVPHQYPVTSPLFLMLETLCGEGTRNEFLPRPPLPPRCPRPLPRPLPRPCIQSRSKWSPFDSSGHSLARCPPFPQFQQLMMNTASSFVPKFYFSSSTSSLSRFCTLSRVWSSESSLIRNSLAMPNVVT